MFLAIISAAKMNKLKIKIVGSCHFSYFLFVVHDLVLRFTVHIFNTIANMCMQSGCKSLCILISVLQDTSCADVQL